MQTVGEILRTEREKKAMTVKDIEAATSIRALYISAIEDNKYSIVPGEVYLKGFIRNYANYLGLNGQEMVEIYRQNQNPLPTVPDTVQSDNSSQQQISFEQKKEARQPQAPSGSQPSDSSSSKWLIIVLVGVLIAGAGWWFAVGAGKSSTPAPQQPAKITPNTPVQPVQPVQPPTAPVTPPQQTAAKTKPVVLLVKFTDDCWAEIIVDGKEVYEGILKSGESRTWEADQTIVTKFGNAGAAEVTHNGKGIGKLGAPGDVVSRTFGR